MKRRRFLLSGSVVAGGALMHSKISVQPTVGISQAVETPEDQQFPSTVSFNFEPFTIEGRSLPTDGDISVRYRLVEDGGPTVDSTSRTLDYKTSNATVGTSEVTLTVRAADINFGVNHRLEIEVAVLDSGGTQQFSGTRRSGTFSLSAPTGGVSRYTMDDTDVQSGTLLDAWGSNDASLNGGITTGAPSQISGESFDFDGSNDYLNTGYRITAPFTWTLWFKKSGFVNQSPAVIGNRDSSVPYVSISWNQNHTIPGSPSFSVVEDGTNAVRIEVGEDLVDGEWHFLAGTYDQSTITFYADGRVVGTGSGTFSIENGSVVVAAFQNLSSNNFFSGSVDDVRIYNRVLSTEELDAIYNDTRP